MLYWLGKHPSQPILSGQGPGLVNVLSLLSGYSRNLHMKVIFNFHTPFHTRTPHCLTRPQAVRVTRRQTVTHPQAVTRPGTGNVHGCPLTTPNRPSRLPPSDPAIHRQADRHATTTHPHHTPAATSQSLPPANIKHNRGQRRADKTNRGKHAANTRRQLQLQILHTLLFL